VIANGSASFQSHPNHANTFRPNPADRAITHTKDVRAETGSFGAFKPNTCTCARFFLISRARERVWKGMCHLRLLAFAGMIGREGSARLHHSDQEMGDPSVLDRSLRRQLRHPPCSDAPPLARIRVAIHPRYDLPDLTINVWHSVFVRAVKKDGATSGVFWRTYSRSTKKTSTPKFATVTPQVALSGDTCVRTRTVLSSSPLSMDCFAGAMFQRARTLHVTCVFKGPAR